MVCMFMGHKKVVDIFNRHTHIVENLEDSVAAAGIHHKIFVAVAQGETGIIKVRYRSVSGTEYIKNFSVHEKFSPFRCRFFCCVLNMNMLL